MQSQVLARYSLLTTLLFQKPVLPLQCPTMLSMASPMASMQNLIGKSGRVQLHPAEL